MHILHISDLHTGISKNKKVRGIEYDQDIHLNSKIKSKPKREYNQREKILKNEIAIFKKNFEEINETHKIDLVIVSGDISVTGKPEQFENLINLYKIFLEKEIAVQIVMGNHDLDYDYTRKGEDENKFIEYNNFIKKYIDTKENHVIYDYDNDFSFFIAPTIELVFIGLNSCEFINHIKENDVEFDIGYLYKIEEVLKRNEFLKGKFSSIPKVLISHFGWDYLEKSIGVKKYVKDIKSNVIFAGHEHTGKLCHDINENIYTFQVGSLLSPNKARMKYKGSIDPVRRQFNLYDLDQISNKISFNFTKFKFEPDKLWDKSPKSEKISIRTDKFVYNFLQNIPKDLYEHLILTYNYLNQVQIQIDNKFFYDAICGINILNRKKYCIVIMEKSDNEKKKKWIVKLHNRIERNEINFNKLIVYFLEDMNFNYKLPKTIFNKDYVMNSGV